MRTYRIKEKMCAFLEKYERDRLNRPEIPVRLESALACGGTLHDRSDRDSVNIEYIYILWNVERIQTSWNPQRAELWQVKEPKKIGNDAKITENTGVYKWSILNQQSASRGTKYTKSGDRVSVFENCALEFCMENPFFLFFWSFFKFFSFFSIFR